MKLIDEWKTAYRFTSVKVGAVGGALLVVWLATPADTQHMLLAKVGLDTPAAFALVGVVVAVITRLVKQDPPKE